MKPSNQSLKPISYHGQLCSPCPFLFVSPKCFWSYMFHCDVSQMRQRIFMWTKDMFVIRVRFRATKSGLNIFFFFFFFFFFCFVFPAYSSKAVPLLQFLFVRASVVSSMTFVLSWFVPHLSLFWCHGKYVLYDWCISWLSLLTLMRYEYRVNIP